jgi:hypothetical protein
VFRGTGTAVASIVPIEINCSGDIASFRLTFSTTAATLAARDRDGVVISTAVISDNFLDGDPHLITIWALRSASTALQMALYIDTSSDIDPTAASHRLGPVTKVMTPGLTATANVSEAAVGHIVVHSGNPSLSLIDDFIYAAGGYAGETAGARITRLCDEEDVALQFVGDADDTARVGAQRIAPLLDLLQDAEGVDRGVLYEPRRTLGLAYRTRASLYNQTAAAALDYDARHLAPPLEPAPDDMLVRNDVTVSRTSGSSARVTVDEGPLSTQPPPDGVGVYQEQVTVNAAEDLQQLRDLAGWLAHLGTWDEERYPQVTVGLHHKPLVDDPDLAADVAAVDLGDVVTIDNPPAWLPPDTIRLMAQGATEEIDKYRRVIRWNTTPAGPYTVPAWGSKTSASDEASSPDHYDTAGSELASGVTSSATSLSVATTLGPIWTTSATNLPLDIGVGGERMTVTAISGATSPQTFTVTRSVNGVVKAHSAGADVRLWQPAIWTM